MTQTPEQWIEWCELRLRAEAKYCMGQGAPAGAVKAALTRIRGFGLQLDAELAAAAKPVVPTDAQVDSACLSYRHDFGLLDAETRTITRLNAKEWLHAWQKELSVSAPPQEQE